MSRTGHYSGGGTIIRVSVPRSKPSENTGGALAAWIEDYRRRANASRLADRPKRKPVTVSRG